MIDIHCHILHDFDDGASTLEESLEMARIAIYSGVTEVVATPHFRGEPEFLEQQPLIDERYHELKAALEQLNLPLKLHKGAEVLCLSQTPELAAAGLLPTIGNSRYVLTEFYFDESFTFMNDCLSAFTACGYQPVIAHPERYDAIQRDPTRVQDWVECGFALQLNKGSILGSFGSRAERTANALLELGFVHMFASDAHGSRFRTPHIGALTQWAEEYCDSECARILLTENPSRILQNLPMAGTSDGEHLLSL